MEYIKYQLALEYLVKNLKAYPEFKKYQLHYLQTSHTAMDSTNDIMNYLNGAFNTNLPIGLLYEAKALLCR